jgi:DNA-directed RNA polymerase subunit beta
METETDGFLGVRIDRKRKAPVTQLLRIFGLESNEEIKKAFEDIDAKYISATLAKDEAKNADDSFVEI